MLQNREKAVLIAELSASHGEPGLQNLVKLLEILVQEARVSNDTATGAEVAANQGEIRAYLQLRECILRGLPTWVQPQ